LCVSARLIYNDGLGIEMTKKTKETKEELEEHNQFLKDLKESFEDIRKGRVHKHKFLTINDKERS